MAKSEMKKIVAIMVMIMLVFAQADDYPPPSSNSAIGTDICFEKCALKCKHYFNIGQLYIACLDTCRSKCHNKSSTVA